MLNTTDSLPLGQQSLLDFTKMVRESVGLSLDESKDYLLNSRLTPLAKESGHPNYASLIRHLNDTPIGALHWQAFEALLTNETMFFRDEDFFCGLKDVIIPSLVERKKSSKKITIWCASVSTGQEAYSLAILIRDCFPQLGTWDVQIHASDVCKHAISKARGGTYTALEVKRGLSGPQLSRHFSTEPSGSYVARPGLREMINFFHFNLVGPFHAIGSFDLILIRNVMIYFSPQTKQDVTKKICDKLVDEESFLMLGASESLIGNPCFDLHRVGQFSFYRKKSS